MSLKWKFIRFLIHSWGRKFSHKLRITNIELLRRTTTNVEAKNIERGKIIFLNFKISFFDRFLFFLRKAKLSFSILKGQSYVDKKNLLCNWTNPLVPRKSWHGPGNFFHPVQEKISSGLPVLKIFQWSFRVYIVWISYDFQMIFLKIKQISNLILRYVPVLNSRYLLKYYLRNQLSSISVYLLI